jgi:hypothetical protein
MGEVDSEALHHVQAPTVEAKAHAGWVLLGCAGVHVTDHVPPALQRDARDVLGMLDVSPLDVRLNRPRRRRVVRKRR